MLPPVRVDEGSTASTATLCPSVVSIVPSASMNVDLPTPGTPVIPTRWLATAWGQQAPEQLLRQIAVVGMGRFDERDGLAEVSAIGRQNALFVGVEIDLARHHVVVRRQRARRSRSSSRSTTASAMTVPGGKIAAAPAARNSSKSCGGITPPTTIMMSSRPERSQLVAQCRDEREVSRGERRRADDVHVGLDRLLRHLGRCLEQRADVDVEAEVGERRGDHLLATVVAVLAHLGDHDARSAAVVR